MAALVDAAVKEVLAGERSVLAFEDELVAIFNVSLSEITDVVRAFFQKHAKDGKVSFVTLRRYLTEQQWHTFADVLTQWQKEALQSTSGFRKEFTADVDRLLRRKKITNFEELQYRIRYALEKRAAREQNAVFTLMAVNTIAAYYTRYYDMSRLSQHGMVFTPLSAEQLNTLVFTKWDDTKFYGDYNNRIERNVEQLIAEYEIVCQQAIAAGQTSDATAKLLANRMKVALNRERSLVRTEINRAMSAADIAAYKAADISQYKFVAVLDEVTTVICQELNGQIFRVSQAQEQVNLPPMHVNCRSSTEPVLTDKDGDELLKVSRTMSLEQFVEKYYEGEFLDEVLDFLQNYRK